MRRLKENSAVINFNTTDFEGKEINLSDYKGKKILLSFFRMATCPFCNLRIRELINLHPEFERNNIAVIALFTSSKEEIEANAGKQQAPFPIIPDPELKLYKQYGIESSHAGMFKVMRRPIELMRVMFSGYFNLKTVGKTPWLPADFLIDENQNIYRTYYGSDFGDHVPITEVLRWVK